MTPFYSFLFIMALDLPTLNEAGAPCTGSATFEGKVVAKDDGRPLAGAIIQFPDLKVSAVSKTDGTFKIEELPALRMLVKVSLEGFETITEIVDLAQVTKKDFVLEAKVTEMNDVVVTGTSKATELKRDPAPITLVDHRFIALNASTNIIETLNKVPGVSTLTTGPNVSKPRIRGLGSNRVLTLFDGVRQEGQQWGEEHGVEVDQFLIDRVEVVKGPASLVYGSDALAGVVNLLPPHAAPVGTITGSVLANYQTNNNGVAGSVNMDENSKGFIWGGRYSQKLASNYRNRYDGRVFGTKYDERDLNAYVGVNRSWGYAHLSLSVYDNVQEIPDGSRDSLTRAFTGQVNEMDTARPIVDENDLSSYRIGTIHQHVQHYRAYAVNSFMLGTSRLAVNIGFQRSIRREFGHPEFPELAALHLVLNTTSYDAKLHLPERHGWETTVGVNGMHQVNDASKGTELVVPSYRNFDIGPFVHAKRSFGLLDLSIGARHDVRDFRNSDMFTRVDPVTGFYVASFGGSDDSTAVKRFDAYRHTFSGTSLSAGLAYSASERVTLKANIARGYRAPNAAEISAKGVHPGTGYEQLGDIDLKPEFNLQEDVGVFFSGTHVSGGAELFNNRISDYIYNEKLISVNGGDSIFMQGGVEYPVFKFRQTSAWLFGGEISLDIHPHPYDWLHFENTLSFVAGENRGGDGARITDSTRYLPLIPPLHTSSELRADLRKRIACFAEVFVKVGAQVYAAQDRFYGAYGTETRTPGYLLIDAGIGGNVVNSKGRTILSFSILGTNLADLAYQSNLNRLKYLDDHPVNGTGRSGIYNMGRNISLKVVVPFELKREQ